MVIVCVGKNSAINLGDINSELRGIVQKQIRSTGVEQIFPSAKLDME